jgi:hypothetical protein
MATGKCAHARILYRCCVCKPASYLSYRTYRRASRCVPGNGLSSTELLQCSLSMFKKHIESQFTDSMTWANTKSWELDHIVPIKSVDAHGNKPSDEIQLKRFVWYNVRPVLITEHRIKSADERKRGLYRVNFSTVA